MRLLFLRDKLPIPGGESFLPGSRIFPFGAPPPPVAPLPGGAGPLAPALAAPRRAAYLDAESPILIQVAHSMHVRRALPPTYEKLGHVRWVRMRSYEKVGLFDGPNFS